MLRKEAVMQKMIILISCPNVFSQKTPRVRFLCKTSLCKWQLSLILIFRQKWQFYWVAAYAKIWNRIQPQCHGWPDDDFLKIKKSLRRNFVITFARVITKQGDLASPDNSLLFLPRTSYLPFFQRRWIRWHMHTFFGWKDIFLKACFYLPYLHDYSMAAKLNRP